MDYDNGFILQKTVDWSLLNDGMTIPVSAHALLNSLLNSLPPMEELQRVFEESCKKGK